MSRYKYFHIVMALFVAVLLISEIAASKIVQIFGISVTGGVIVFPISYIFGDILTEVYGYARSRVVIWTGFIAAGLMSLVFMIVGALPGDPFWVGQGGQKAWDMMLGQTPRIVLASLVAYFAGEFLNSFVLAKMKVWTQGKWLWTRTIGSTIVGEGLDTVIFVLVGFAGTLPSPLLRTIMITNYVAKCGLEVVLTPLTYKVVSFLKRSENEDYFDAETNFNPFSLHLGDAGTD